MIKDVAPDVVRWVHEALVRENQRLQEEMQAMREELHHLRAERIEAAETLKTFAEHVTRVATLALQRLDKRGG